jgi:hypothetical protein
VLPDRRKIRAVNPVVVGAPRIVAEYGLEVELPWTVSVTRGADARISPKETATSTVPPVDAGPVNVADPAIMPTLSAVFAKFAKWVSSGAILSLDVG